MKRLLLQSAALLFIFPTTPAEAGPRARPKGVDASFAPKRPGPRAPAPTLVASLDPLASRLYRFEDQWHVRTTDGRLLRLLADGAPQPAMQGLLKDMALLPVGKTWYGTTHKGIWRVDKAGLKNVVFGSQVYGVQVLDGHFWWSDSTHGGSIHRQAIEGKSSSMMASNLGPADTFLVRDTYYLVGMRGDEPRGMKRYNIASMEVAELFKSRFHTRAFLTVGPRIFVHMESGAGFIKEILEPKPDDPKPEYFKRLVIAAGGSRAMHVHKNTLIWCANPGVYRLDLKTGLSSAVALNTQARDMVVLGDEVFWIDGWRHRLLGPTGALTCPEIDPCAAHCKKTGKSQGVCTFECLKRANAKEGRRYLDLMLCGSVTCSHQCEGSKDKDCVAACRQTECKTQTDKCLGA